MVYLVFLLYFNGSGNYGKIWLRKCVIEFYLLVLKFYFFGGWVLELGYKNF